MGEINVSLGQGETMSSYSKEKFLKDIKVDVSIWMKKPTDG